ncbi:hypothetical protein [Streptomyces sp. NPDC021020]|uniref:hypothetical protein n=1 Tax=Streptomyces sp. NPDC021020 TaxID=3365109 RepID=UPI0037973F08
MPSSACTPTTPGPHSLWTIARIHDALASPVMVRRFLLDLTHAPEHEVMNVFAAWQRIAAANEISASPDDPTARAATDVDKE